MAKIEGFRVKNYRSLKEVRLGRLWKHDKDESLTPLTAVIGKNGSGKSSLFDAFGFLADCLKLGAEEACDARGRGGFNALRSQGETGAIEFEVTYRESEETQPITYKLNIDLDSSQRPVVKKETLGEVSKNQQGHWYKYFLVLTNGRGGVWIGGDNDSPDESQEGFDLSQFVKLLFSKNKTSDGWEKVELDDKRKLGVATFGSLKQHPRISAFRHFIEGWYLSYFSPNAARSLPLAGAQKHLNSHGDNLGNVVQFMEREHPQQFQSILDRIAKKIPGIEKIDTEKTSDGRLLLRFNNRGFVDPFYAQQMSDGTLKVFSYLLLLEDPTPPPFLCIEEPENGLYHKLLESLVQECRQHASDAGGSQIFITTHQPYLVDALVPEEVWILEKGSDGFSHIRRASSDPLVVNMVSEGLPLGGLWYSDYLEKD
ncbi:MAG: AAA family ATPase [Gammaproteobacteria bacterium]|nr:AAA family ATPase [Gammaproteobacteria bacterium]